MPLAIFAGSWTLWTGTGAYQVGGILPKAAKVASTARLRTLEGWAWALTIAGKDSNARQLVSEFQSDAQKGTVLAGISEAMFARGRSQEARSIANQASSHLAEAVSLGSGETDIHRVSSASVGQDRTVR